MLLMMSMMTEPTFQPARSPPCEGATDRRLKLRSYAVCCPTAKEGPPPRPYAQSLINKMEPMGRHSAHSSRNVWDPKTCACDQPNPKHCLRNQEATNPHCKFKESKNPWDATVLLHHAVAAAPNTETKGLGTVQSCVGTIPKPNHNQQTTNAITQPHMNARVRPMASPIGE